MVSMFIYVFSYVIILDNRVIEIVLNMIGIMDLCI